MILLLHHVMMIGWYEGMSQVFLSCPVAKLLILAGELYLEYILLQCMILGVDRLDKELTIAHMQGNITGATSVYTPTAYTVFY